MKTILKSKNPTNWLDLVKQEVIEGYIIPDEIEKKVAIDLGVNIGAFALVNHGKFENIFGLEASSENFKEATNNIKKENIGNVLYFNLAASNESDKTLKLRMVQKRVNGENVEGSQRSGDYTVIEEDNAKLEARGFNHGLSDQYEEVRTINFTDALKLINADRINYLKCDIEGSEYDFLMDNDLGCVDYLAMELHYTYLGQEKVIALINHLLKYFNFYDEQTIHSFTKNWPPPPIVNLINKRIVLKKSRLGKVEKNIKQIVLKYLGWLLIPVKNKIISFTRNK
jgi:FkbM family methyltransferase